MSLYSMSYDHFDELEEHLREFPCPVNADSFVPDFDEVKKAAQSERQYLMFLIWYQAVVPRNSVTKGSLDRAWNEINDSITLY